MESVQLNRIALYFIDRQNVFHLVSTVNKCTKPRGSSSSSLASNGKSLVTGGANILKVYRLIPDADPGSRDNSAQPALRICSWNAWPPIRFSEHNVPAVGFPGRIAVGCWLLVNFQDAKLSVVQFDPDNKTLSLHYFEEEDIKDGWTGNYHTPVERVDPDNRCAIMLVYGRKLVVLPFRKGSSLDEIEVQDVKPIKAPATQIVAKPPILASYVIEMKQSEERIDNMIHIQYGRQSLPSPDQYRAVSTLYPALDVVFSSGKHTTSRPVAIRQMISAAAA